MAPALLQMIGYAACMPVPASACTPWLPPGFQCKTLGLAALFNLMVCLTAYLAVIWHRACVASTNRRQHGLSIHTGGLHVALAETADAHPGCSAGQVLAGLTTACPCGGHITSSWLMVVWLSHSDTTLSAAVFSGVE